MYRYGVVRFAQLRDIVVPFFTANPLRTAKRDNFDKFATVIELMTRRRHLTVDGLVEIAGIVETMNHRKPSVALRILRDHTPALFPSMEEDEMVRPSWRHEEAGGNDQPAA
jgi:hypothetical protein